MNKLKMILVGALAAAGAWCAEAADAVPYLEPVFGKHGETTGFVTKTVTDYTLHKDRDVGEETWNSGWYVIDKNVKVDVCLHVEGDVKIILKEGATLTVNKSWHNNGGMRVDTGNRLTVYAQSTNEETMGKLVANGGENGSAIGSGGHKDEYHSGYITINGGVIEAQGGKWAAAIGGGKYGYGRHITINGGKVTATAGERGAGIGGSYHGGGYDITINGGTVKATGGKKGAGIGGGDDREGYDVTINGGTVVAQGGENAPGIGSGYNKDGHDVTINGGTVTATGGKYGAGIGGACTSSKNNVTSDGYNIFIHGGTVTATAGELAAGIGGGVCCGNGTCHTHGHDIWITGGTVTATGGSSPGSVFSGAGIGAGYAYAGSGYSLGYNIHITGGKVTATGGNCGAGIGGSYAAQGYDIFISGGTVIANAKDGNAIGAGYRGKEKQNGIQFNGGSITLNGQVRTPPVNAAGARVYKTTVTGLTESPDAITGIANFGGTDIYPDGGKAYLYLPAGNCSFRSGTKRYSGTVTTDDTATFNPLPGGDTYGVTVDGTDVSAGSGTGWTYSDKVLTLSQAKSYTLAGANLVGLVRVKVTANAAVTIDKLQLACPNNDTVLEIAAGATAATLTLVGDSSLTASDAAIGIADKAKVTLAGSGALVGGKGSYDYCRGVNVASGGTFVMDGGTIRDYMYRGEGGAIYNAGTFTMNGGALSNCEAGGGGGVCNHGTMTMNGGTIADNEANETNGGAILNYSKKLYIYGGTVHGNHAVGYGGAIENWNGYAYIYGGVFTGNGADTGSGYIIDCLGYRRDGYLYGSVWDTDPTKDNDTTLMSGATVTQVGDLYVVGRNPKVFNGWLAEGTFTFDPLKAEYEAAGLKLMPGSVAVPQGTTPKTYVLNQGATEVTVNGVSITAGSGTGWSFANNVLTLSSAMDYAVKGLNENPIRISVTANAHVTFKNFRNVYDNPDWDVVVISANATLTLEGSNQIYAKNGRAAIGIANGATLTLNGDGELVGGKADNVSAFCVWVEPTGTFVMDGGTIRGYMHAGNCGGVRSKGTMTMNGGTICDCSADYGGGIYINGTFTMDGGTIRDCSADYYGGGVCNYGTMTMNGGAISDCNASADGGGIVNYSTLDIYGGAVCDNHADGYGGAVAIAAGCHASIYGGVFTGNKAERGCDFLDVYGDAEKSGYLYGGVWDIDPAVGNDTTVKYGAACKVLDNYIVAKDLAKNVSEELTGGTYTFDPSAIAYIAEGVMLAEGFVAEPKGGSPATYEVRMAPTGFTINGTDLCALSGTGWEYRSASQQLVLSGAGPYTLSGDSSALGVGVSVSGSSATVVLSNATVVSSMNVPLMVDAMGVKVKLVGENKLAVKSPTVPAMAVPITASVTIECGEGCANTNACLTAIGGHAKWAIGGKGDVTVLGGTIVAEGGINGANVAIKGGIVTAVGRTGMSGIGEAGVNVTISGGTVVAQGDGKPDIDGNVHISGGSVQADLVSSPKNAADTPVFRVTVPDVTNVTQGAAISGITGAGGVFDDYGQKDLYPLDNALSLWLTNGYYNAFYVDADKVAYFAQVSDEPTVAYRKTLDLYVNGQNIGDYGGTGWYYDWEVCHLMLAPGEGEDETNRYVITGTATDGSVKAIVVEGSCDVTAADLKLGVDGAKQLSENLLQIGNGDDECTVNLTITGESAFMVANREGAAPLGVKNGATLNFRGSATIQKWDINVEDDGRVTAEDPKTLTFTSEDDADAAALVVKPLADASVFPEIDQVDYAALFDVSVVTGAVDGTWTLDYQLTDETVQAIAGSLADAETELAANLAKGDPSTTISDSIPGIYYALASAPSERALNASSPSGWYAAQGGNMEVAGATYAGGTIAYYQLRATWKPLDVQEIAGTVMVPPDVGMTVDGTDVKNGEGEGWTFSCGILTLTNADAYVIAGKSTNGDVRVNVTANADVTLDNLTLANAGVARVITFEDGATDAALTLVGDNTVYSRGYEAVCLQSGAKVALAGTGTLVGGKSVNAGCRGVFVNSGAAFVMDGGTIRGYRCANDKGGAIYCNGSMTMNGGTISGCDATGTSGGTGIGGAIFNNGSLTIFGGAINDCSATRYGGAIANGSGHYTDIYGGTFKGNSAPTNPFLDSYESEVLGYLYGGVWVEYDPSEDPEVSLRDGATVQEVSTEGGDSNYVVGKDIKVVSDQLTEGTYTFCPTNAQYEAVELFVEPGTLVTKKATTPTTWVLGVECPDYLAGYGYAVTNTFKKWAKQYPPGDPDGIYKNAFLLNVAQTREQEAVAAFKIGSIAVTNEVVDAVTNTVVVVEVAKPIDGAEMFNGITWLQCATNGLDEADFLDIGTGRYTEAEKSFFIQRIDFEHKLTPEAFPEEPEGTKTMKVKLVE